MILSKKVYISILLLILSYTYMNAQSMDCASVLKYRIASHPYKFSNLSKSAICCSGNTYELVIPLISGNEYRFSFFASSVFNHKIKIRIFDLKSNKLILDLPGDQEMSSDQSNALRTYFNNKLNKLVHPHYDFIPLNATRLKIIIEIPNREGSTPIQNSIYQAGYDEVKGCVTVFIQDKKAEGFGFK